ncbi:MAG: hypothetical protein IJY63_04655 [Clostridia bacterium]|nr:hypothetical protein [Clostridia bacterium]
MKKIRLMGNYAFLVIPYFVIACLGGVGVIVDIVRERYNELALMGGIALFGLLVALYCCKSTVVSERGLRVCLLCFAIRKAEWNNVTRVFSTDERFVSYYRAKLDVKRPYVVFTLDRKKKGIQRVLSGEGSVEIKIKATPKNLNKLVPYIRTYAKCPTKLYYGEGSFPNNVC